MHRKIRFSPLLTLVVMLFALGCADNRYYDYRLQMEVQQLDSDLDNRWSTTGVVIIKVDPNGPAARANLKPGELISYVIGERAIKESGDYKKAEKKAMKDDNNFILKLTDGREIRMAVRRKGDKVGLHVDGKQVSKVRQGSPTDTAGIKVGDTIESITDERNVRTIKDYKKAIKEFAKHDSRVRFRMTELEGVKIASVSALGNVGDVRAVDPLIEIFENSTEIVLRKAAAKSLERLVALGQLNDLFQKFERTDESLANELDLHQRESAEILGLLIVDLEENRATLTDPFGTQFRHRSEALHQKVNTEHMVELAKKYIKREVEPAEEIRRACLSILGYLQPKSAINDLIAVMEDSEEIPGIRFQAGLTLSQIGEAAVDRLIAAFNRGDASVKDIAAPALGNIGGLTGRKMLIEALKTIEDQTIKLTVVGAIAKIGDKSAISALLRQEERFQEGSGLGTFLNELLEQMLLLRVELKYLTDLNKKMISEELREAFKKNTKKISLSQSVTASIQETDSEWWIDDPNHQRSYIVRREEGELKIFEIYENLETPSM